ncbi:MAG: patatin-like phospholipase family protein [Rickettsiales bacterium]
MKELEKTQSPTTQKSLLEGVDFVSGVSGGSVTAAYFVLKGPNAYDDFRENFLEKNAEENLITDFGISTIVRLLTFGGVNDRSHLPKWLDKNLFHEATYADVLTLDRPVLWIGASDIFNRTPFVFSGITFRPLCSDISKVALADAVSASAAVPAAFTPVNVESFADQCEWTDPAANMPESKYNSIQATVDAFHRYRDTKSLKYVKLLDGGLTDNFGIQGIAVTRLAAHEPYAPVTAERAIRLKRLLFIAVDSGRGPVYSKWNKQLDNPDIVNLAGAVTDTSIDSSSHMGFDFLQLIMHNWERDLIKWRCSLSRKEVKAAIGDEAKTWKCDNVKFYVTQVSFKGAGSERLAKLDKIPTRFVLPKKDVDFLIESAEVALQNNKTYRAFLEDMNAHPEKAKH